MKGKKSNSKTTKDKNPKNKLNKSFLEIGLLCIIVAVITIILIHIFGTKKYDITFDTDGGSLVESIVIKKNETIKKPTNPTKDGYIFAGWYYNDELYEFDELVSSDMTLVARWQTDARVTGIKLNKKSLSLYPGDSFHLSITITPENATNKNVIWKSSSPNVVKVDSDGNIKALKIGTATITVITEDGEFTSEITVSVKRKINKYVVSYKDTDGTKLNTVTVEQGKIVAKPKDPTKEGHTFIGWYNGETKYTFEEKVTANLELTAKWEKNIYKVTFVSEGKTLETKDAEYGSTVTKSTDPTKEGHTFIGWYNGETKHTFEEKVTDNLELTAKWEKNVYKITFENYDGKTLETKDVEYGTVPTYTGITPTKVGNKQYSYTFKGWNPSLAEATKETTYTATYEEVINKYEIKFVSEGKTLETKDAEYGSTVTKPKDPTKEGHTFIGWYNGETKYTFEEKVTDNLELTAKWEKNVYKITFENYDGKILETKDVEYGTVPTYTGITPTKVGNKQYSYTFKGWNPSLAEATKETTYTATYEETINKYKVTFVSDGKTLETKDVEYGSTVTKPTDPTKEGHTFIGWYNGETKYTFEEKVTDNLELTAKWEKNVYKVTFVSDGKTLETKNVEYGNTVTKPTDPTKEGHTFIGWYNGETKYTFEEKVTANLELTAKWEKNVYKVTFVSDGKTLETKDAEYGSTVTKPTDSTKEGHTFIGWYNGETKYTFEEKVTANLELTAKWEKNVYKVTFVSDGKTLETKNVEYGNTVTKPTDPTKEGHTFIGWYNGETKYTFEEKVTDNLELTAKWEKNVYKITFENYDGKILETKDVEYGTVPTYAGITPTKVGNKQYSYTFKGWNPSLAEATKETTYTATYEETINKYKVTFVSDGKTLETKDVEYGSTVTKPKDPTKEGHTFIGWYNGETKYTFEEKVTDNLELTAKWEKNVYKVTFVSDGKTLETKNVEHGNTVTKPTDPTKEGHTFIGWYNGETKYTFEEKVTANLELTAGWKKNVYKITFVNYDGKILETKDVEYGTVPTYTGAKPEKTKDGQYPYLFTGWEPSLTEVTKATTYTAVFKYSVDVDGELKTNVSKMDSSKFYIETKGNNFNIKFTSYTTTNIFGDETTKYPPYQFIDLFSDVVNLFDLLSNNDNYESFEFYYKKSGDNTGRTIDLTKYNLKDTSLSSWYGNGANDAVGDWIGYLATGEPSTWAAYSADSDDLIGKTITITITLKEGYVTPDASNTLVYYLSFYNA